jgi:hypothetical protein
MFRLVSLALMLGLVIGLSACGTTGSMQGHASENGAGGRIRLGLPF